MFKALLSNLWYSGVIDLTKISFNQIKQKRLRFGTIDGVESPMDEYSEKSGFVNHSFYDNVYPWEYIKPKKPLPTIAPSQATYLWMACSIALIAA